jgi:hypothetical protein
MKPMIRISCIVTACLLAACEKSSVAPAAVKSVEASPALRQVFETLPTGDSQEIHRARTTAQVGEEITLRGRIMGSASPFVAGRALFILGDPSILTPCNEIPGDTCETPWDVCCDSAEDKKIGTATIQIVDAEGRVLKEAIEGVRGIEKLAWVKVRGKVAAGSSADLLLVNASAIQTGP